jgi:hypothetical protein
MRKHAKPVVLLAGLVMAAGILAACRPVQVTPAETVKPATPAATPDSILAATLDAASDAAYAGDLVTLTLTKPGDKSTLGIKDEHLLIDIESASGIGTATVIWTVAPTTPVLLRLHLSGLEELRLANGNIETVASVSSSPPHVVSQSTRSESIAEFQSITEGDPAWLDISWASEASDASGVISAAAEMATFPLQDGYFDIILSDPRLTKPGAKLEIRWIDFYR